MFNYVDSFKNDSPYYYDNVSELLIHERRKDSTPQRKQQENIWSQQQKQQWNDKRN